ncbi:MAG: bacteriohemerythrin [Planctomycetota bacterium]
MSLFAWDNTYSVGIPHIDEQHEKLVSYINKLHQAMLRDEEDNVTSKILNELTDYIKNHFAGEEDLMVKTGFSDHDVTTRHQYERHKMEHAEFTRKITDMIRKHYENKEYISVDLLTYLVEWLLNHIASIDKQYAAFIKNKHNYSAKIF